MPAPFKGNSLKRCQADTLDFVGSFGRKKSSPQPSQSNAGLPPGTWRPWPGEAHLVAVFITAVHHQRHDVRLGRLRGTLTLTIPGVPACDAERCRGAGSVGPRLTALAARSNCTCVTHVSAVSHMCHTCIKHIGVRVSSPIIFHYLLIHDSNPPHTCGSHSRRDKNKTLRKMWRNTGGGGIGAR